MFVCRHGTWGRTGARAGARAVVEDLYFGHFYGRVGKRRPRAPRARKGKCRRGTGVGRNVATLFG